MSKKITTYLTRSELAYMKERFGEKFDEWYNVVLIFTPEQFEILANMRERLINASWTSNKQQPVDRWGFYKGK